jgi:hypothetical protein
MDPIPAFAARAANAPEESVALLKPEVSAHGRMSLDRSDPAGRERAPRSSQPRRDKPSRRRRLNPVPYTPMPTRPRPGTAQRLRAIRACLSRARGNPLHDSEGGRAPQGARPTRQTEQPRSRLSEIGNAEDSTADTGEPRARSLSRICRDHSCERFGDEAELGDEALLAGDEQAHALGRGRHQFFSAFRASRRGARRGRAANVLRAGCWAFAVRFGSRSVIGWLRGRGSSARERPTHPAGRSATTSQSPWTRARTLVTW